MKEKMKSYYVHVESTPEQKLQGIMNSTDRKFVSEIINEEEWYQIQMEAIEQYKQAILK